MPIRPRSSQMLLSSWGLLNRGTHCIDIRRALPYDDRDTVRNTISSPIIFQGFCHGSDRIADC